MNETQTIIEFWGGPLDGRVETFSNPTDCLMMTFISPPNPDVPKELQTLSKEEILYDFSYRLPTGVLLYRMRRGYNGSR